MNYVISDVKARRKQYTDMKDGDPRDVAAINERMLTVDQYHTLARRVIGKWAPPHAKAAMLGSEDAIDYVAHLIMIGDWGYKAEKSDIKTYRGYCGKRAIIKYLKTITQQQQGLITNLLDSLEVSKESEESKGNVYDVIADNNAPQPYDRMASSEAREEARRDLNILMGDLNDTQRACIIMHHIDDIPMADIGRELGITREGVRRSIEEAMKAMRKIAGVRIKKKV